MNKKLLTVGLMILSLPIIAQVSANIPTGTTQSKQWKIKSFGGNIGTGTDMYRSMSMDWMRDHASNEDDLEFNQDGWEQYNSMIVFGASFGTALSLKKLNPKSNSYSTNQELKLGLNVTTGREAAVSFMNESQLDGDTILNRTVMFCLIDHEITFSGEYLVKTKGKYVQFYTGLGGNLATVLNNEMLRLDYSSKEVGSWDNDTYYSEAVDDNVEYFRAKATMFARGFIPMGVNVNILKMVELSLEHRRGVGVEKVIGGKTNFMATTGSTMLGLSFII